MKSSFLLIILSALLGSAIAKTCKNITSESFIQPSELGQSDQHLTIKIAVPVKVTASTIVLDVPPPKDEYDLIGFVSDVTSRTAKPAMFVTGRKNITGTYDISATYCYPPPSVASVCEKNRTGVVQVLTHGLGFDKS